MRSIEEVVEEIRTCELYGSDTSIKYLMDRLDEILELHKIEALPKDEPKKIIKKMDTFGCTIKVCPTCHACLYDSDDSDRVNDEKHWNRCIRCGQNIVWE